MPQMFPLFWSLIFLGVSSSFLFCSSVFHFETSGLVCQAGKKLYIRKWVL